MDQATPVSRAASAAARHERQGAVGVALGLAVIGAWVAGHVYAIWFLDAVAHPFAAVFFVLLQCWLSVGLFIVAHDAMHGSLSPGRPEVSRGFGQVALGLFAGFSYDSLVPKHHAHHRYAGTADDPDFDADHPTRLLPWYGAFMREYFSWWQFWLLGSSVTLYALLLWDRWAYVFLFWALPSILASVQLFVFGTFLPHRHDESPFADRHNARSNEFPVWLSLLTCFHFGYHHEHHLRPGVPWWRLPAFRRALAAERTAPARSI